MLGESLFHFNGFRGRSPMEAWPVFQRVLALEPGNPHAMLHLARLAAREGRVSSLDSLVDGYLQRHQDAERSLEMRALRAYARDDTVESAAVANLASAAGELTIGSLLVAATSYAQRPDAARRLLGVFRQSVTNPAQLVVGRRRFTDLPMMGGQWDWGAAGALGKQLDADWRLETHALVASDPFFMVGRAEIVAVRDSVRSRPAYQGLAAPGSPLSFGPEMRSYLVGLLSVRLDDTVAASRAVQRLRAQRDSSRQRVADDLARAVVAEMARSSGDAPRALEELDAFTYAISRDLSHWGVRERFLRAELLHALGRDAEALPWYEGFGLAYDLPWVAAAHLRSGEIYERQGNAERAVFHYSRVISLWKECDPVLRPLVARAEQAMTRLRPSRD
jgi:tetratricopeptide (TPR) repeat protein